MFLVAKNSFHAAKLVFEVDRQNIFFCPLGIPLGPGHHISPTSKGPGDCAFPGIFSHFRDFGAIFATFPPNKPFGSTFFWQVFQQIPEDSRPGIRPRGTNFLQCPEKFDTRSGKRGHG